MRRDETVAPPRPRAGARGGAQAAVLWSLAAAAAVVGVWASFAPASFYADFVLGRGWVALDGAFNEHLVRDVGALNLALAVVTVAAAHLRDRTTVRIAAAATLVFAVPHLAYHATAMDPFPPGDVVAQYVALTAQVVAALYLLRRPVAGPAEVTGPAAGGGQASPRVEAGVP